MGLLVVKAGTFVIKEVRRKRAAPPGRHFNPGFSQVEIGRNTAHALNRTRDLRIMSSAL